MLYTAGIVACFAGIFVSAVRNLFLSADYHFMFEQMFLTFGGMVVLFVLDPGIIIGAATLLSISVYSLIAWKVFSYEESGLLKNHELQYLRKRDFNIVETFDQEKVIETKVEKIDGEKGEVGMEIVRHHLYEKNVPKNCLFSPNADKHDVFEKVGIGRWKYYDKEEILKKFFGIWFLYDFFKKTWNQYVQNPV